MSHTGVTVFHVIVEGHGRKLWTSAALHTPCECVNVEKYVSEALLHNKAKAM